MAWKNSKYKELGPHWQDYNHEYRVWIKMIARCNNPNAMHYARYGGRGIKVCPEWADPERGFISFYRDMGQCPVGNDKKRFQLDRTDNNKGYFPQNCRWVSKSVNMTNRNCSRPVLLNGEKISLKQACEIFKINRSTVSEGVRLRGKTLEEALCHALELKGYALSPVEEVS